MAQGGAILARDVFPHLEKEVVHIDTKELRKELKKLKETPVADMVVKTGVQDYGLPADAKERRM